MKNDNKNNDNKKKRNNDDKKKDSKIVYSPNKNTNNKNTNNKNTNSDTKEIKTENKKKSKKDIYSSSDKFKSNKTGKTRRTVLKIILIVLLILILSIVGIFLYFFLRLKHEKIDVKDLGIDESQIESFSEDIVNMLVLGIDKNGTSDAILVVSIDSTKKTIKLISLLRDSVVRVEPKGKKPYYTKLTEAYGNGGAETTIRTINKNFNLNIKSVTTVDFLGMANIVDELGGLDVTITRQEKDEINGIIATTPELKKRKPGIVKEAGNVHLNGTQVVAYSRIRKDATIDGQHDDYGRTYRLRTVAERLYESAKKVDPSKFISLINTMLPYVSTSLSIKEIQLLCSSLLLDKSYVIEKTSVPLAEYTINPDYKLNVNGIVKSTVYYNLDYAKDVLNAFIYKGIVPEEYIKTNPPPKNGGPLDGKSEYRKEAISSKNLTGKNQKEQQSSNKKEIEQEKSNKKKSATKNNDKKAITDSGTIKNFDKNKTKKITDVPQNDVVLSKKQETDLKTEQNSGPPTKQNNAENESENKKTAKQNETAQHDSVQPKQQNENVQNVKPN